MFEIAQPKVDAGRPKQEKLRQRGMTVDTDSLIVLAAAFPDCLVMHRVRVAPCKQFTVQFIVGNRPRSQTHTVLDLAQSTEL
jgi:hypothetical protein